MVLTVHWVMETDNETTQTFERVDSLAPFFCCMVATGDQHSVVLQ